MKAIAAFLAIVWFCLTPIPAQSYVPDDSDDGSIRHHALHWSAGNADRQDVQGDDYGGKVPAKPELVWFTPTVRNADGTLPPPFKTTPLMKSILDAVFNNTAPSGGPPSIFQIILGAVKSAVLTSTSTQDPAKVADPTKADQTAAGQQGGDSAGGAAKDNAAGAIDFCSRYMQNFASDGSNRWNKVRDTIFMPIAVLLLLPGAVLAQVKAIAAAGNPVLGNVNPFDGILRSIVAIFLIPASYLVISFGIDFSNCISFTISDQYTRLFGTNMYKDALCGQLRAMPTNGANASQGNGPIPKWQQSPDLEEQNFGNGSPDPCGGAPAPKGKVNEAMPAHVVYSRLAIYGANAASTTGWNVLCAFQMAYLCYLFLVGPIVAALWVWPIKQFRDAFPSWIEGVITLCFWSLFWNTTILLMACFKDSGTTGTYIFTALNFLATSCVKYAFDFSGLVAAAGQEAAQKATQPASGGGGGAGGKGGNDAHGKPLHALPPGAKPYMGADHKMHFDTTGADGHKQTFTYDPTAKTWNPDSGTAADGTGGSSAGATPGSGNPILPVNDIVHPLPPLSGKPGTLDTVLPNSGGEHLHVTTDKDGNKTWAVFGADDKTQLASGSIEPGASSFQINDGAGGHLSDTVSIANGLNGMQDLKFTDTATGAVLGDQTFNASGQQGYTMQLANGDSVSITDIGNGLQAVSVTNGTTGQTDTVVGTASNLNGITVGGDKIDASFDASGKALASMSITTSDPITQQESTAKFDFNPGTNNDIIATASIDGVVVGMADMTKTGASWDTKYEDASGKLVSERIDSLTTGANGALVDNVLFNDSQGKETVAQTFDSNGMPTSTTLVNSDGSVSISTEQSGNAITTDYSSSTSTTPIDQITSAADGTVDTKTYDQSGGYNETKLDSNGNQILTGTMTVDASTGAQTYQTTESTYTQDQAGNWLVTSTAQTTDHYDNSGALVDGKTTSFDALGQQTGSVDINKNQGGDYVAVTKDANGHIVQSETTSVTGGYTNDTVTKFDANNNPSEVITTVSNSDTGALVSQSDAIFAQVSNGQGGYVNEMTSMTSTSNTGAGNYQSYDQNITHNANNPAPESFNFNPQIQSTNYSQQGTVDTINMASGFASYDTNSHAYSFGATPGQPQFSVSFDQSGNETVTVGNAAPIIIPAAYQDGQSRTIPGTNIEYSGTAQGNQTFKVGGSTYSIGNGGNVSVNGQQGSLKDCVDKMSATATKLAGKPVPRNVLANTNLKLTAPIQPAVSPDTKTASSGTDESNQVFKEGAANEDGEDGEVFALDAFDSNAEADALYKPGTQSLQRQMMDAANSAHMIGTFNSVLSKVNAPSQSLPEAVVQATVDQNFATMMLGQGKYAQAEQLYRSALKTMEKYTDAPEYKILLDTYANFLDRQGRHQDAAAYRSEIVALEANKFEVII
ncbi:hypothetical protein BH10CYA1_BH10CYA1_18530 [soil metagenome]